MIMAVWGKNWDKAVADFTWDEPLILVGTVTGGTRTMSVYRDSDLSLISTETNTDGDHLKAGTSDKICMGLQEDMYYQPFSRFHGEVEQVVVYDKALGQQD